MGIFGPSKSERLTSQYILIQENDAAISEGKKFLGQIDQIKEIIDPGFISEDLDQIINSYRQAYSLTMMYRYILFVTVNFNQVMGTIFGNSLTTDQQAFADFLKEVEGKMIKLRARAHSKMEVSEIKNLESQLNLDYGQGRYGDKCL